MSGVVIPHQRLLNVVASAITEAFQSLLSEKHLYQSVSLDGQKVRKVTEELYAAAVKHSLSAFGGQMGIEPGITPEKFQMDEHRVLSMPWFPGGIETSKKPGTFTQSPAVGFHFDMPTIHTFCRKCQARWPFNSKRWHEVQQIGSQHSEQWFYLAYECQSCKGDATRFLVRRTGNKLILSGRDPIESIPIHKDLPKTSSKFFCDALIAHQSGQTLAGLFLLRVFIEQFWRSIPAVKTQLDADGKLSGDKQGDIYNSLLPDFFKSQFQSLGKIYSDLSIAIHNASADAELFEKSSVGIIEHFEARRLLKLAASFP